MDTVSQKGRRGLRSALCAVACTLALPAWGDPGDHIRVGDSTVITPGLDTGVEFRSNAYLAVGAVQSATPGDRALAAFNFFLEPWIDVRVATPKVRFAFDGRYTLRKFFVQQVAENLDQYSAFNVGARLDVAPESVVGFHIRDRASLNNRASDNRYFTNALLTQLRNELAGGLTFRVGPEFKIDTDVAWAYHNFRIPGVDAQRALNTRDSITPSLTVAWNFFPRTAFVVESNVDVHRWFSNWIPTNQPATAQTGNLSARSYGEYLAMPNSTHVKAWTGVRGRLTDHLVVSLMLGYGTGLYSVKSVAEDSAADPGIGDEADPDVSGFGVNVSGTAGILAVARFEIDLGYSKKRTFGQKILTMYRKEFTDSFFTNFLDYHMGQVGLKSRWGRYLRSDLSAAVRAEKYSGEVERNDVFWSANGAVHILPAKWMDIELGASWVQRASSQAEIQYDNVIGRAVLHFTY